MARAVSIPHRRRFRRTLTTSPPWPAAAPVAIPLFYRGHLGSAHLEEEGGQLPAGSESERHALAGEAIRASHRGAALLVQELLRKGRNDRQGL